MAIPDDLGNIHQDLRDLYAPLTWAVVVLVWIQYCLKLILILHQKWVFSKLKGKLPQRLRGLMEPEVFELARLYEIDIMNFTIFAGFYGRCIMTAQAMYFTKQTNLYRFSMLSMNILPKDANEEETILFGAFLAVTFFQLARLPVTILSIFYLEEKYGFNRMSVSFFVVDLLKKMAVSMLIVLTTVHVLVTQPDLFAPVITFGTLALLMFYPQVIAPIFDDYRNLRMGALQGEIRNLADQEGFASEEVYVVNSSRRSIKTNGFYYGILGSRRIVLYDTIIKGYPPAETRPREGHGCTNNEVKAIFCHELGHWKLSHVPRGIFSVIILGALVGSLIPLMVRTFLIIWRGIKLPAWELPKEFELIPEAVLEFVIMTLIANQLSRFYEYQADEFAVSRGFGTDLRAALIKTSKDNLQFPMCDPLYDMWLESHPSLMDRLAAIDSLMPEEQS